MRCPACGRAGAAGFARVGSLPLIQFPVDREVKDRIASRSLRAFLCSRCEHIFTPPLAGPERDLLYGRYYRYYPYDGLETMQPVYREAFEAFFERVLGGASSSARTLLEVGCSSGRQLAFFRRHGLRCTGIDPSPLAGRGIISGNYETQRLGRRYDVLLSRFNLEHLNDIGRFFRKAGGDLTDGGLLFVQVPNIPAFAASLIPLFLAHEHIHYFNAHSLTVAARRHGFATVAIEHAGTQSILAAFTKGSGDGPGGRPRRISRGFYAGYGRRKAALTRGVRALLRDRQRICFYGAGLALSWIAYELGYQDAGLVLDDNPRVRGRFLPRTNWRVADPGDACLPRAASVLLTLNPVYHPGVVHRLRKSGFTGPIWAMDGNGLHQSG